MQNIFPFLNFVIDEREIKTLPRGESIFYWYYSTDILNVGSIFLHLGKQEGEITLCFKNTLLWFNIF